MAFHSGNSLLDALPRPTLDTIFAHGTRVELERNQQTMLAEHRMGYVDFPLTALMAVYGALNDGSTVELVTVGREGFVEVDAALDLDVPLRQASCQFAGSVLRLPIADFRRALYAVPEFGTRVRHHVRARQYVTEQNVMCNVRHSVRQRLARWMLYVSDRLARETLEATHEFIAAALGTQRASVSLAAAELKTEGAIGYDRGNVTVTDRSRLIDAACECYAAMRAAIDLSVQ